MYRLVYPIWKKIYKYKGSFYNNKGFTLLEILIVVTIIGFLATMVVPVGGYILESKRVNLTQEKLEMIKTAIIGAEHVYDERGFPVVRGYVGDMRELPRLYKSEWDTDNNTWKWDKDEINDGKGQPRGLWEKVTGEIGNEDNLGEGWQGPYISYPIDIYPDNTKFLDHSDPDEKELFEKRSTNGKLSDAWGNSLLFWKEYVNPLNPVEETATLWIISGGRDGEAVMSKEDTGSEIYYTYKETEDENKDNIVIKITPNEWYRAGNIGKEDKTLEILTGLRTALMGRVEAVDAMGRKNVDGYIGDMGDWPKLYEWDSVNTEWKEISDYDNEYGQPIYLWKQIPDSDSVNHHRWKGPYINEPLGKGGEQVIKDAWGNKIRFERRKVDGKEYLRMVSAGIDGDFDEEEDNLHIDIFDYEWQREWGGNSIPLMDKKRYEDTEKILKTIHKAFLGADAFDASGRRIVGGYLGDMGKLPQLYTWDGTSWVDSGTSGQPRNLWEEVTVAVGFEWNGPYLLKPFGTGEKETLKDAWGNPLEFELNGNDVVIRSGGADGDLNTPDDLVKVISKSEWQSDITIKGRIYNETEEDRTITIRLYHQPDSPPAEIDLLVPKGEEETSMVGMKNITFTVSNVSCGKRRLEITGDGLNEEINIFIGTGGTQSPTEDKLNFYIK